MEKITLWLSFDLAFGIFALLLLTIAYGSYINRTYDMKLRGELITRHRKISTILVWAILITILSIEIWLAYNKTEHNFNKWWLWVHLACVVLFTIIIILLKTKITGLRKPRLHKKLAYTALALFIPGFILGIYLLFN